MVYLLNAFHFALHKRGGHIPGRCLSSSFSNASVTLIGAFRFLACAGSKCFWHRSPWRVSASLDGASAPAVVFCFLIAPWLGGVAGVTGRIEEHMGCALSPTSAGNVPPANSLCLLCILLQMWMKAVRTAVVSVAGRVWAFLGMQASLRLAFGSRGFLQPHGQFPAWAPSGLKSHWLQCSHQYCYSWESASLPRQHLTSVSPSGACLC